MAADETRPTPPATPSPTHTGRILIVEDEFVLARDLQDQLTFLGYQVVGIAASSEQAWALAVQHQPDVVLMDIRLQGGTDGITTAARMRQACNTAIIYTTAYITPELLQRAAATFPAAYLTKPIRSQELQANLRMALYQRQVALSIGAAATGSAAGIDIRSLRTTFGGISLLVVESDVALQSLYADYLGLLGATVHTATTIAAALTQLAQTPVALIISELQLSDGNGQDLLKQVRQQEYALARAPVPLVAITTVDAPTVGQTGLAEGFADCLVKPFSATLLQTVIQRWVPTSND